MENLPSQLRLIFWIMISLGGTAALVLATGFSLLLGTTSHRNVALPLIWAGGAVVATAVTALVLISMSH